MTSFIGWISTGGSGGAQGPPGPPGPVGEPPIILFRASTIANPPDFTLWTVTYDVDRQSVGLTTEYDFNAPTGVFTCVTPGLYAISVHWSIAAGPIPVDWPQGCETLTANLVVSRSGNSEVVKVWRGDPLVIAGPNEVCVIQLSDSVVLQAGDQVWTENAANSHPWRVDGLGLQIAICRVA